MINATYGVALASGGVSISKSINRSGEGSIGKEVILAAAKAGVLTTRTDNDTGVITSNAHGYADTETVDVYWDGGARYDMDLTAVAANTLDINGGNGDNLPIATTAVVICKQTTINVAIDGDALEILGLVVEYADPAADEAVRILFEDAAGDDIASVELTANTPLVYDIAGGASNPFTGDPITVARASHANVDASATVKIVGVDDSTP
jgi:hypothetical protein